MAVSLFLHHRYEDLPPRDLSGNGNDGTASGLTGNAGRSAVFDGTGGWVMVPQSASMQDLRQVRIQVSFRIDPGAGTGRMNLVEGFVSFALYVDGNDAIHFSIVDANQAWTLCSSGAGAVRRGQWHTVVAAHDGITESRIALDGDLVASNTAVAGPVPPVGATGVAIGRWPDQPRFLFQGEIAEIALYRFDPEPELMLLLGADCVDPERLRGAIDSVVARFGGERGSPEEAVSRAGEWATQLMGTLNEAAALMLEGASDPDTVRGSFAEATLAFGARDAARFRKVVKGLSTHARTHIPATKRAELLRTLAAQREQLGLTAEEVDHLAKALCLTHMPSPAKGGRNVR